MEVVCSFEMGGSERLAALLADRLRAGHVRTSLCATAGGPGPISAQMNAQDIPCFAPTLDAANPASRRLALYRLFRRERVDVLHLHHAQTLALCYWPARLAGVRRLVMTEHTDYDLRHRPRVWRGTVRYAPQADAVTVIHERLGGLFTLAGVPAARLHRIPNGIDTDTFKPVARSRRTGPITIGWIGRMHPDKDLTTWLRAAARVLAAASRPLRFSLVGDGPDGRMARHMATQLDIAAAVEFHGEQNDVLPFLRDMDLFVLSSRTEGVPMVLLEAMACGLPCVATDVGGIAEIIAPAWGRLVPPGDPSVLAGAMQELIDDAHARRACGAAARSAAVEHFGIKRMLERYAQVLTQ